MCKTEYVIGIIKNDKENKNKIKTTAEVLSLLDKLLKSTLAGDFIIVYKEGTVEEIMTRVDESNDSKLLCLVTTNHIGHKLKDKYTIIQIRNHKYKILNIKYKFNLCHYIGVSLPYGKIDFEPNNLTELLGALDKRFYRIVNRIAKLTGSRFGNIYKYLRCISTDCYYGPDKKYQIKQKG